MSVLLVLTGFANIILAARSVSKKWYGWATFNGLIALGCYIMAAA